MFAVGAKDDRLLNLKKASMRKNSGFVLFVLLAGLVLAACAGGVVLYATRMPDPQTADLRGLLRWLVTRDLSQEPDATQEQLLSRLEGELRGGLELTAGDQLTEDQRARLVENADLLGRRWFLKQVEQYTALAASEKATFLDRQIDEVQQSGVVQALVAVLEPAGSSASTNAWSSLNERIGHWTARMEAGRKAKVEEFLAAVKGNLLWRTVRGNWLSPVQQTRGG
jgi:hypothetical protein